MFTEDFFYRVEGEDVFSGVALIKAIPDGMRLDFFPNHTKGAECWCRPKPTFLIDEVIFTHKDLFRGEFDC